MKINVLAPLRVFLITTEAILVPFTYRVLSQIAIIAKNRNKWPGNQDLRAF